MPLSPASPSPPDTCGTVPSVKPGGLRGPHHTRSSHLLHQLGDWSSKAAAGVTVSCLLAGWTAFGAVTGFPSWWQTVLYSTTSAVTVVMVFAIQHTHRREQLVIQRKLDELVRAQPRADDRMIAAEAGTDAELDELMEVDEHEDLGRHASSP